MAFKIGFHKTIPTALPPKYPSNGASACFDLCVAHISEGYDFTQYDIGLQVVIPTSYVALMMPNARSPNCISFADGMRVIDSTCTESLFVRVDKRTATQTLDVGEVIAQMFIIPRPFITFVDLDSPTARRTQIGDLLGMNHR